jgi:hypothetical protein
MKMPTSQIKKTNQIPLTAAGAFVRWGRLVFTAGELTLANMGRLYGSQPVEGNPVFEAATIVVADQMNDDLAQSLLRFLDAASAMLAVAKTHNKRKKRFMVRAASGGFIERHTYVHLIQQMECTFTYLSPPKKRMDERICHRSVRRLKM